MHVLGNSSTIYNSVLKVICGEDFDRVLGEGEGKEMLGAIGVRFNLDGC